MSGSPGPEILALGEVVDLEPISHSLGAPSFVIRKKEVAIAIPTLQGCSEDLRSLGIRDNCPNVQHVAQNQEPAGVASLPFCPLVG